MRRRSPQYGRFAALLALLLLAAAGALDNILQFRHTLAAGRRWAAAKVGDARPFPADTEHMTVRPALRGNALDLYGLNGFIDMVWRKKLRPARVEFEFLLEGPYLDFVFNRREEGLEGVRLGGAESFYFAAEPGGRFLRRAPLEAAVPRAGWNRFSAVGTERGLELTLNGAPAGLAPARFVEGLVGFRGSAAPARVDGVRVAGADGRVVLRETFHHWNGLRGGTLGSAAALGLAAFALAWVWRSSRGRGPLLAAALLAAAQWGFSLFNFHTLAGVYPSPEKRRPPAVRAEGEKKKAAMVAEIHLKHDPVPPPGATRIMVLGTSQAWGLDVDPERTFVRLLEKRLNVRGRGRFECVNASVMGERPVEILQMYDRAWKTWGSRLVVVNLSPKRDNPETFDGQLAGLLALNRSLRVRTLLVNEARSYPRPKWRAAARELAERHGAAFLDMQARLEAAEDRGLIWFDRSHLTPFGHELAAEALEEAVLSALR